ncbi:MAG: VWA domain-containing protein [Burkholderiales bacterium]|nr:VWA domain-containing protein [Burkholderiales bacterium]
MDTIDSRATLIIVGDGRNNYNEPRVDLFRRMARRSHRTLWLNPESPLQWGTGDSDMLQYAPYCDTILKVSTLAELTSAVDKLLS